MKNNYCRIIRAVKRKKTLRKPLVDTSPIGGGCVGEELAPPTEQKNPVTNRTSGGWDNPSTTLSRGTSLCTREAIPPLHKVILCVVLIIALLMVPVSASAEGEKLLELDLDGFKAGAPADTNIINGGTSETAVINIGNTTNVKVNKNDIINISGKKVSYLRKTHSMYNWVSIGSTMDISDLQWEKEAVTFSFWADLNTVTDSDAGKCVAEYKITYDTNGTTESAVLLLAQLNYESQTNYAWNIGYNNVNPISMANAKGWSHVVITNPMPDGNGNKTLDLYINGIYKKSKTITIPDGATITSATLNFGGTSDDKMVPTDASYGEIAVYKGALTKEEIADLYESQKDMYTPYDGESTLGVYDKAGQEQSKYLNYADIPDGMDINVSIDNVGSADALNVNVYSAVRDESGMKEAEISEAIEVPAMSVGYKETVPARNMLKNVSLGDRVDFYLWTDEITPLTMQKSFYVKDLLVTESGGCRLIIHTDKVPQAATLKPEAFTVSDTLDAYKVDQCIYYPLTKELHLIIKNAAGISAPCRVQAEITDVDGKPMVIDIEAGISSIYDNAMYGDSIKYLAVFKDGKSVGSIYENGLYKIEICAVLQGESRVNPVDIVVYKMSGEKSTEIVRKTEEFTEDDILFEFSCELKRGDKVYAKVE